MWLEQEQAFVADEVTRCGCRGVGVILDGSWTVVDGEFGGVSPWSVAGVSIIV